jgi:hypothetical protein
MLVVAVLLTTVLMRVAIIGAVAYLLLPQGSLCPHCGVEMVAIRNRFFDRLVLLLQRRWCLECGWNGIVRRVRSAGRAPDQSSVVMSRAARSKKK